MIYPHYTRNDTRDAREPGLTWRRTTRAHPCPICGHRGWCEVSSDGAYAICMRIESNRRKVDAAGCDYWVHRLDASAPPPPDGMEICSGPAPDRASPLALSWVYSTLLAALRLAPGHRENLRQRGLTDEEIDRRGYRSLPARGRAALARELVERFGADTCRAVPGFYVKQEEGRAWWSLAGRAGLLIPVRDRAARIVALKVRADVVTADEERYSYLSSRRHGGAGPGAPPHVPLYAGDTATVRLTEGELKGDVATALSGMLTISVAGVSCYRSALPVLRELGANTVHLAFDMDWQQNRAVRAALERAVPALRSAGFRVMMEVWG